MRDEAIRGPKYEADQFNFVKWCTKLIKGKPEPTAMWWQTVGKGQCGVK
jgi:hypothetical protein